MANKKPFPTLSEFYRNRRPEFFSDSEKIYEIKLPKVESFLATAFLEIYPSTEIITINLVFENTVDQSIIEDNSNKSYNVKLKAEKNHDELSSLLFELAAKILSNNFIIKDSKKYLEKLFKEDEVHERMSTIITHDIFFKNIFGENPKILLKDWKDDGVAKNYTFKRDNYPIQINIEPDRESAGNAEDSVEGMTHNQTKVYSVIDTHLWNQAAWKAFGILATPEVPLGILIAFENEEKGRQIFEDWIKKLGKIDYDDTIKITIVKGINSMHPFWYRVLIRKKDDELSRKEGHLYLFALRSHEMNPDNPNNLTDLLNRYNYYRRYMLFPATYKGDGSLHPHFDLGIVKKQLLVRDAWEIGENDIESAVIGKDDTPIIPPNVLSAPVIALLKKMRR